MAALSHPPPLPQGLSEPLGALVSLLLLQPFFTLERLHYLLAFVGGVMVSAPGGGGGGEGRALGVRRCGP